METNIWNPDIALFAWRSKKRFCAWPDHVICLCGDATGVARPIDLALVGLLVIIVEIAVALR